MASTVYETDTCPADGDRMKAGHYKTNIKMSKSCQNNHSVSGSGVASVSFNWFLIG